MIVPDEEDDDLIETVNGLMTVKDTCATDNEILLGNGAEISLFRDAHLLTDITPTKSIRIRGVNSGDKALLVTHTAMFRGLLQVYYSKDATANILSYCQVGDELGIVWDSERQLFHTTDHELTFVRDGKLFVLTETKCVTFMRSKPVVKNDLVREVQRRLGFPSESTLAQAIRNGSISNLPITVKDIESAVSMEGRSAATLQGKAHTCNSPQVPLVQTKQLSEKRVTLYVDIMYVEKEPYLLSVGEPMGVTLVNVLATDPMSKLGSKTSENLKAHLLAQIARYSLFGFTVSSIVCDSEGGFRSIVPDLELIRVRVEPGASASHPAPQIDRRIRSIKESMRSILASLPYNTPVSWYKHCVIFCVSRFNLFSHSLNPWGASPRESLTGVKTDFRRDVRVSFGDYVQCEVPYTDNSMSLRTSSCIALSNWIEIGQLQIPGAEDHEDGRQGQMDGTSHTSVHHRFRQRDRREWWKSCCQGPRVRSWSQACLSPRPEGASVVKRGSRPSLEGAD
jgi:hypothetical protein